MSRALPPVLYSIFQCYVLELSCTLCGVVFGAQTLSYLVVSSGTLLLTAL